MFNYRKIKSILQVENADCGLACLAMMAGFYGKPISLSLLRQYFRVSLKNSSLLQLKWIAQEMGFSVQFLRIELEHLSTLRLPCLLHWDTNHFVVLSEVGARKCIIFDPVCGRRKVSLQELNEQFTGIVMELNITQDFFIFHLAQTPNLPLQNKSYAGHKKYIFSFMIFSLVIQLAYLLSIKLIQKVMDLSLHHSNVNYVFYFIIMLMAIKLIEIGVQALRELISKILQYNHLKKISASLLNHMFSLPLPFFEARNSITLASTTVKILKVQANLYQLGAEALTESLLLCVILILMWKIQSQLTCIIFVGSMLLLSIKGFYDSRVKHFTQELDQVCKSELTFLLQSFQVMESIKLLSKTKEQLHVLNTFCIKKINALSHVSLQHILFNSIRSLIYSLDYLLVVGLGGLYVSQFSLSIGALFALLSFRQQWSISVMGLMTKWQAQQAYQSECVKLQALLNEPLDPFVCGVEDVHEFQFSQFRLENVSFTYQGEARPVFDSIYFTMERGQFIVVKGPTGCGKTTLLKLMMGLQAPTYGNVSIDGFPLYPQNVQAFRKKVAAVFADDLLLAGSIVDNIRFFNDVYDEERMWQAAKKAGIYQEVMSFPMGFNTLLGERGKGLSSGQQQRILIARALYTHPAILFLDEATKHLDRAKEQEILDNLRTLGVMVVMIAQSVEVLLQADKILDVSSFQCSTLNTPNINS